MHDSLNKIFETQYADISTQIQKNYDQRPKPLSCRKTIQYLSKNHFPYTVKEKICFEICF